MFQPKSIQQMFTVLKKIRSNYFGGISLEIAFPMVVGDVAKQYKVRYQTIGDLCRRRLDLKDISEFYNLVSKWLDGDPSPLKRLLKSHTPSNAHNDIESFFLKSNKGNDKPNIPKPSETNLESNSETLEFRIDLESAKRLRGIAEIQGISVSEWLSKNVYELLNQQYERLLTDQFKLLPTEKRAQLLKILEKV